MSAIWTDENRATAMRLWKDGHSASAIAAHFGPGVTRSAVIGMVHRLRVKNGHVAGKYAARVLKPRAAPEPRPQTPSLPHLVVRPPLALNPPQTRFVATPAPAKPVHASREPCGILDLARDGCKFAVSHDDTQRHLFCNKSREHRGSYCTAHRLMTVGYRT